MTRTSMKRRNERGEVKEQNGEKRRKEGEGRKEGRREVRTKSYGNWNGRSP